jgi:DNA-binding LacI/PurR family transcriptional regulator
MELAQPPEAIVAASDTLGLGALRELRAMRCRVPADVSVVCFDDPLDGDLLEPPMTALTRHYRELGELAAGRLLNVLRGDAAPGGPVEIRVPMELVVRGSCGCA